MAHAKDIEDQVNGLWDMFFSDSEAQKGAQELFRNRMAEFIKDKRLLEGEILIWELTRGRNQDSDYASQVSRRNGVSAAEGLPPVTPTC